MENRKDVTVSLPKDWVDEIDDGLGYGDSRSAWIREAVRRRLVEEGTIDEGNEDRMTMRTAD
jgi:metal-responsive CopG/Arc/MetJ family transcriptional regulator